MFLSNTCHNFLPFTVVALVANLNQMLPQYLQLLFTLGQGNVFFGRVYAFIKQSTAERSQARRGLEKWGMTCNKGPQLDSNP